LVPSPCSSAPATSGISTIAPAQAPLSMPNTSPSPRPLTAGSEASGYAIVLIAARGTEASISATINGIGPPPISAGTSATASIAVTRALARRVRARAPSLTVSALVAM
jgi:hypothetical protein